MQNSNLTPKVKRNLEIMEALDFLGIDKERMGSMTIRVGNATNLHKLLEAHLTQEEFKTGNVSIKETFTIHTVGFLNATIILTTARSRKSTKIIPLTQIMDWIK